MRIAFYDNICSFYANISRKVRHADGFLLFEGGKASLQAVWSHKGGIQACDWLFASDGIVPFFIGYGDIQPLEQFWPLETICSSSFSRQGHINITAFQVPVDQDQHYKQQLLILTLWSCVFLKMCRGLLRFICIYITLKLPCQNWCIFFFFFYIYCRFFLVFQQIIWSVTTYLCPLKMNSNQDFQT